MARRPETCCRDKLLGELDFDIHASGQIELHQRVHGGGVGLHDIEQPLISANFKLLTRLLVDVRPNATTVDALMKLDLAAGVNVEIKLA